MIASCNTDASTSTDGAAPDASVTDRALDASVDIAAVCSFPNGRECDPVIGCPDSEGCNWCVCGYLVPGVSCDLVGCLDPDGGPRQPRACSTRSDCRAGETCAYNIGCSTGALGVCTASSACQFAMGASPTGLHTICRCDGTTVSIDLTCGVELPYAHAGACP